MNEATLSDLTPAAEKQPLRIFLVEDSEVLRELLLEAISTIHGVCINGFSDSEDDAFERICASPCDIVIVDIQLKQGNGIALLRRLATQPRKPQLINIILSNNVGTAYRRIIDEFDVCFFFDKTTEFSHLQSLLQKLGAGTDVRKLQLKL